MITRGVFFAIVATSIAAMVTNSFVQTIAWDSRVFSLVEGLTVRISTSIGTRTCTRALRSATTSMH